MASNSRNAADNKNKRVIMSLDIFSVLQDFMKSPEKAAQLEELLQKAMASMKEAGKALQNSSPEVKAKYEQEMANLQVLMKEKMEVVSKALGVSVDDMEDNLTKLNGLSMGSIMPDKKPEKEEGKKVGGRRKKWVIA